MKCYLFDVFGKYHQEYFDKSCQNINAEIELYDVYTTTVLAFILSYIVIKF